MSSGMFDDIFGPGFLGNRATPPAKKPEKHIKKDDET